MEVDLCPVDHLDSANVELGYFDENAFLSVCFQTHTRTNGRRVLQVIVQMNKLLDFLSTVNEQCANVERRVMYCAQTYVPVAVLQVTHWNAALRDTFRRG